MTNLPGIDNQSAGPWQISTVAISARKLFPIHGQPPQGLVGHQMEEKWSPMLSNIGWPKEPFGNFAKG